MTSERPPLEMDEASYAELQKIMKEVCPLAEIWAYGSRAAFTARPQSDLDLVVLAGGNWRLVQELRDAFDESNLPFSVDCWNWDDVPENFRKEVLAGKVVIQKPSAGLAEN